MSVTSIHREVVKAAIRMRYGTLEAFADANGIKAQQVRDLLRGQSSRAKGPVGNLLGIQPDQFVIVQNSTTVEGDSTAIDRAHSLNEREQ